MTPIMLGQKRDSRDQTYEHIRSLVLPATELLGSRFEVKALASRGEILLHLIDRRRPNSPGSFPGKGKIWTTNTRVYFKASKM